MPISAARSAAFEILLRVEKGEAYASELLHSAKFARLSPADHGLLTELVMGVLRWRSVLDAHIAQCLAPPVARLDLEVLTALRLGVYQLLFLDRIPTHAAVNESVELVKQARKRSAAGIVNAVLRKVNRDPAWAPDTIAAHPQWLVQRWNETYGHEIARKICEYNQSAPEAVVRVPSTPPADIHAHRMPPPPTSFWDDLAAERIQLKPGRILAHAAVVSSGDITKTKSFRDRQLIIQDEASQLVALMVGKGNSILDCCAAPGGKTRILAEDSPDSILIAVELHPHRARLLKKLASAENVRIIAGDIRHAAFSSRFDRVLVDAPCTGTGTLARNPEIKWRLKPGDFSRIQAYQVEILRSAMNCVAPGGRLVYSTCSLEPEENSQVIEQALASEDRFRLLDCRDTLRELQRTGELIMNDLDSLLSGPYFRTLPGVHPCDGFFAAIMKNIDS